MGSLDVDAKDSKSLELGKHVENIDDTVLQAQGHVSELDRSFSWIGAIGMAYRYVMTPHQPSKKWY